MIRIYPLPALPPTDENASQLGGPTQDLERAIVILQLKEGQFYTPATVALHAWEKGTKEYKKQCRRLQGMARKYLKHRENVKIKGVDAWPPEFWRDALFAGIYRKASEIILLVCEKDEEHREAGREKMAYWFDPSSNRIIERDLDHELPPELPASHLLENIEITFEESRPSWKHETTIQSSVWKSWRATSILAMLLLLAIGFIFHFDDEEYDVPTMKNYFFHQEESMMVDDYIKATANNRRYLEQGAAPPLAHQRTLNWEKNDSGPNQLAKVKPPYLSLTRIERQGSDS